MRDRNSLTADLFSLPDGTRSVPPSRRVFEPWRPGQTRAVYVGQVAQGLHDLGTFEGLGFDAVDDRQIDTLLRQQGHRQENKDGCFSHPAVYSG